MNGYWLAANVVLGVHMALLAGLTVGLLAAALGVLRRYPRLALGFWATLVISAVWQPLPSCILTDMERWLRHRVEPEWDRTVSAQRMLIRELVGVDLREEVFWWVGVVMVVVAGYAFWRYHRDQAGGMVGRLLRGSR
jgi:hypothetical protein